MGDMGDLWRDVKETRRERKENYIQHILPALIILWRAKLTKFGLQELNCSHWRIGQFDFWPTTGTFINRITGKRSNGIKKLLNLLVAEK